MWLYDDPDSFTALDRPEAPERRETRDFGRRSRESVVRRLRQDDEDYLLASLLPAAPSLTRRREQAPRTRGRERTSPRGRS